MAATWDQPDRNLIASLFGIGAIVALLFVLIPHERVVRSRWREPFFLLWSITHIALTTVVVAADGGSTSPLALLFFVPVVFAALSYPLASVVVIGALDYLAYVAVGRRRRAARSRSTSASSRSAWPASPSLCGWHARNQDRRRDALARVSRADPLTGCLNRRGFEERFDAELSRARAPRSPARPDQARPRPLQGDQRHARPRRRRRRAALGGRRDERHRPPDGRRSAASAATSSP